MVEEFDDFQDVPQEIHQVGETDYNVILKDDAKPVIMPPRKVKSIYYPTQSCQFEIMPRL